MGRRLVAALAVTPLLALSGCADARTTPVAQDATVSATASAHEAGAAEPGAHEAGAAEALALAAGATAAAGSARTTVLLSTGPPGAALEVTGEGVVDFATRSGRHVLRLPEELGGSTVEQLAVGGAVWVRSTDTHGRYVELLGAGLLAELLGLLPATDPAGQIAALGSAEGVRRVGSGDVRGVATTRYEARLPLAALADDQPAALREHLAGALGEAGVDTVTLVVDVDEQGRLRRLAPALGGAGDDTGSALGATVELHDFGVEVDVQPPRPDEVDRDALADLLDEVGTLLGDGTESSSVGGTHEGAVVPSVGEVREGLGLLVDELLAE